MTVEGACLSIKLLYYFLLLYILHPVANYISPYNLNFGIATYSITNLLLYLLLFYSLRYISTYVIYMHHLRYIIVVSVFMVLYCIYFIISLYLDGDHSYLPGFGGLSLHILPFIKVNPYIQFPSAVLIGIFVGSRKVNLPRITKLLIRSLIAFLIGFVVINHDRFGGSVFFLHNAFVGAISHILLAYYFFLFVNPSRRSSAHNPIYALASIAMLSLPFLGTLRGASMASVLVIGAIMIVSKRNTSAIIGYLYIIILIYVIYHLIFSDFEYDQRYGYTSPIEVITVGFSPEEHTAQQRLSWWTEAIDRTLKESVLVGHQMRYTFMRSADVEYRRSAMLHNYYVSAFADGGLLLLTPIILIIIRITIIARRSSRKNRHKYVYLIWIYSVLWERITNTYAFSVNEAAIEALVIIIATANIISDRDYILSKHLSNPCLTREGTCLG